MCTRRSPLPVPCQLQGIGGGGSHVNGARDGRGTRFYRRTRNYYARDRADGGRVLKVHPMFRTERSNSMQRKNGSIYRTFKAHCT
ncbi:hypothetical protein EVAR_58919_1 [Eumeta japonica]|uniref:Uncharacterized protein n=1 Tax=Eumeta variegata TaxID=151549 RepID=A0A4C1Y954_EUMVA|nr:hypothetical protein EVAR_58919_1 [Eumeta japonica]